MLPAPTLDDVKERLSEAEITLYGILFAPPYTATGKEGVIPRLGYLNARTAKCIHFFCAGYGGYQFAEDIEEVGDVGYEDGTVIPWGFSQSKFASFVTDMESTTSWRYSGESDLLLVDVDQGFSKCIQYDLEAMLADGAIESAARLFESIIQTAHSIGERGILDKLSDKLGLSVLRRGTTQAILKFVPDPAVTIWTQGRHFAVRDLTRKDQ